MQFPPTRQEEGSIAAVLQRMSPLEARAVLNDEQAFQAFFDELEVVQNLRSTREKNRDHNETLAVQNLAQEEELNGLMREVASLQQKLRETKEAFNKRARDQQQMMKQFTTAVLLEKLASAAAEAEAESDQIGEQLLAGQISVADFTKTFLSKRKLFHLRAAKREYLMLHHPI
jgi:cysteinyl-tRNA synthetase